MNRVVTQIKNGVSAGKWRAKLENYGLYTFVGIYNTEIAGHEGCAIYEQKVASGNAKLKVSKATTKEEWKAVSRAQIIELSKKYS